MKQKQYRKIGFMWRMWSTIKFVLVCVVILEKYGFFSWFWPSSIVYTLLILTHSTYFLLLTRTQHFPHTLTHTWKVFKININVASCLLFCCFFLLLRTDILSFLYEIYYELIHVIDYYMTPAAYNKTYDTGGLK